MSSNAKGSLSLFESFAREYLENSAVGLDVSKYLSVVAAGMIGSDGLPSFEEAERVLDRSYFEKTGKNLGLNSVALSELKCQYEEKFDVCLYLSKNDRLNKFKEDKEVFNRQNPATSENELSDVIVALIRALLPDGVIARTENGIQICHSELARGGAGRAKALADLSKMIRLNQSVINTLNNRLVDSVVGIQLTGLDGKLVVVRRGINGRFTYNIDSKFRLPSQVDLIEKRMPNVIDSLIPGYVPKLQTKDTAGVFYAASALHNSALVQRIRAYANGLLNGSDRPINAQNPKFAAHVGTSKSATLLMLLIGFSFSERDQVFIPIPEEASKREFKLRSILMELACRQYLLRKKLSIPAPDNSVDFIEGLAPMLFTFGVDGADSKAQLSKLIEDPVKLAPYLLLGCMPDASDEMVKLSFMSQIADDASGRQCSQSIQEFAAIEVSKEQYQLTNPELEKAYRVFNLNTSDEVSDDLLIQLYQAQYSDNPMDVDSYRNALRTIAEHKNSEILLKFLDEGYIPDAMDGKGLSFPVDSVGERLPCGLNNVGNTCYLNSLLQLYYSIPVLRKKASSIAHVIDSSGDSVETSRPSKKFAALLTSLMNEMSEKNAVAITPQRDIVEIVLKASTEELQFGVQQDVNECMDHILDLLEDAFKIYSENEADKTLIKSTFFGVTQQVLYGDEKQNANDNHTKDEEFSSLIVDVHPELYGALDKCFQDSIVEYNGQNLTRVLSISKPPPVLTITLRRVQYSLETQTSFKSNMFMRFEDRIYLDRYFTENRQTVEDIRKTADVLAAELESLSNGESSSRHAILQEALEALQEDQEESDEFYEAVFLLTEEVSRQEEEAAKIRERKQEIAAQQSRLYDSFRKKPYILHAVLFHQGEAQYGHYWIYLKDHRKGRWLKYNDSVVSVVSDPETEIFGDAGGNTNPYCLVYLDEEQTEWMMGEEQQTEGVTGDEKQQESMDQS
ncbi:ubiquitin-specific protease ubp2 [Phlyctochytrium bullatum]|nr:ubiquitin-specific protease ubp2 [Phlyctochytrium bullatum]